MQVSQVPFIDLLRYEDGFLDKLLPQVEEALRKGFFVGGPAAAETEKKIGVRAQARNTVLCANGTDALQLALRAAGLGPGDKVLVPNMTFWASVEAIVNVGAEPIPVDVDLQTLHLNLESVKEAHEQFHPSALMLVHLYGWAAPDTLAIRDYCSKEGIKIIEDSAQAYGTLIHGKSLIGSAELATTSFYPAKVLGASGDAGAVFSTKSELADLSRKLSNHGRLDHYEYGWVGWNSRVGIYECLFMNLALDHLDQRILSRRKILDIYRKELAGLDLEVLSPVEGVEENGYLNVLRLSNKIRNPLKDYLAARKIGSGVVYPGAMSRQAASKSIIRYSIDKGHADTISKTILNLPCFAYMTENEAGYVVDQVKSFFKS